MLPSSPLGNILVGEQPSDTVLVTHVRLAVEFGPVLWIPLVPKQHRRNSNAIRANSRRGNLMSNDESSPFKTPRHGPRFQFSLATLMVVATVVSVLCSLSAWLGPAGVAVLILLAIGPVGGTIIVPIRKSKHDWAVAVWSGVTNMVLWGIVVFCGGLVAVLSGPPATEVLLLLLEAVFLLLPFAFVIGVLASVVWEVAAGVTKETWKLIVLRYGSGLPSDGVK